jgi:hypothetical protein
MDKEKFLRERFGYRGGVYKISTARLVEILTEWENKNRDVSSKAYDSQITEQWGEVKQRMFGRDFVLSDKDKIYRKDDLEAVVVHHPLNDGWGLIVVKDKEAVIEKVNLNFFQVLNEINKI